MYVKPFFWMQNYFKIIYFGIQNITIYVIYSKYLNIYHTKTF